MTLFFNDTATTEIYTLSLHDALPIFGTEPTRGRMTFDMSQLGAVAGQDLGEADFIFDGDVVYMRLDRKSTRLNSSHANISYAVFCLKKKKSPKPSTFPPFRPLPSGVL